MKIKNTEVEIVKGSKTSDMILLDKAVAVRADIYTNERKVRCACVDALKLLSKLKKSEVKFFISREAIDQFDAVAIAKICAQEVYRSVKEDHTSFKKVSIVLPDEKNFNIFSKTIHGYLNHLLNVLTQGPFVTVDTIIEVEGGIVLIKRSNPPFGWAIPGGFLDYGETLEGAAAREAKEETGLSVENLVQLHTYSDPSRDPRFQTITTVFVCQAKGVPAAASDASEAHVYSLGAWQNIPLAFDHRKVLEDYLKWKKI